MTCAGRENNSATDCPGPANQQVRQPVRRLVQVPVRHRELAPADRHGVRLVGDLRGEQLRNRHRRGYRPGQRRPVADFIVAGTLEMKQTMRPTRDARVHAPSPAASGARKFDNNKS
mgnify:CR=1 FL=1